MASAAGQPLRQRDSQNFVGKQIRPPHSYRVELKDAEIQREDSRTKARV